MSVLTRSRSRAERAVVLSSVAAVVLVGCGDQVAQTPTQRVQDATSSLFDSESLTISVGLDLDDATRDALVTKLEQEQAGDGADEITPAAVDRLLGARIVTTMTTTDGTELSEIDPAGLDLSTGAAPPNVSSSVAFVVDGESLVEVRQVEGILYVRTDVEGLEQTLEAEGMADGLRSVATQGAPPALVEAVDALATGGWVSIDTAALLEQLEELGATTPGESPSPDTGAVTDALQGFLADAQAVIAREIVITETGEDAFTVTAPLDRIVASLAPSLESVVRELAAQTGTPLTGLDGAEDDSLAEAQEALAGRTATLDVTVEGDRLRTVRMDLAQFLDEADRKDMTDDGVPGLPVLVELGEDGEVQAPDGATELDLTEVVAQLMAVTTGTGEDAGAGVDPFDGLSAEDLGMTEEEFADFQAEMGLDG